MNQAKIGLLPDLLDEYKNQLKKGLITKAYRALIKYLMSLRLYFKKKYPDFFVSSNIYYGYMDMSYFAFFSETLKQKKLKVAVVFIHESFRFEVWLIGYNKKIQKKYWSFFKKSDFKKYSIPPTIIGFD